jgi:hypothetical protein
MADRTALHLLVDSLPEEAMEATFRVLENYQKWPPKGPADAESLVKQARATLIRQQERHAQRMGCGVVSMGGGSSSFNPDGYGRASNGGWDGHTRVTATFHYFRGHELHTVERLRLSDDKRRLLFSLEGKTPTGTVQSQDFWFDLASDQ